MTAGFHSVVAGILLTLEMAGPFHDVPSSWRVSAGKHNAQDTDTTSTSLTSHPARASRSLASSLSICCGARLPITESVCCPKPRQIQTMTVADHRCIAMPTSLDMKNHEQEGCRDNAQTLLPSLSTDARDFTSTVRTFFQALILTSWTCPGISWSKNWDSRCLLIVFKLAVSVVATKATENPSGASTFSAGNSLAADVRRNAPSLSTVFVVDSPAVDVRRNFLFRRRDSTGVKLLLSESISVTVESSAESGSSTSVTVVAQRAPTGRAAAGSTASTGSCTGRVPAIPKDDAITVYTQY
ncbi:uncharacterized protein [Dermacentor albipictus]|uniref:uncharacterized protein isoform X2 n=1 Tax=Dermacentor albipictus TaxID=60249 RepID=UPI0038FC9CF4